MKTVAVTRKLEVTTGLTHECTPLACKIVGEKLRRVYCMVNSKSQKTCRHVKAICLEQFELVSHD